MPRTQRVGGAVDGDDGNAQRGRQMQRASVAAHKNSCAARERNKLANGALQLKGIAATGFDHGVGQVFFTRGHIDQGLYVVDGQRLGHLAKPFRRPLLGSPACTWVHDREAGKAQTLDLGIRPVFP